MSVVLTGGSGFIGARLIQRLRLESEDLTVLVRPSGPRRSLPGDIRTVAVDLTDADEVRAAIARLRPSVIYHAAMPSGHPATAGERLETLAVAVSGTANLAEAAAASGVRRFVHLGSFLGYRPQARAIREDDAIEPRTARGAAKAAASVWLRQFASAMSFPAVELRIFSVYGPGEPASRFIPVVLRAARDGSAIRVRAGASRDLVYVDDVVEACLRAAVAPLLPGAVFNIGGGATVANEALVEAVRRVSGRPIQVEEEAYRGGGADGTWLADISAAASQLGWTPSCSLEDGLAESFRCLS